MNAIIRFCIHFFLFSILLAARKTEQCANDLRTAKTEKISLTFTCTAMLFVQPNHFLLLLKKIHFVVAVVIVVATHAHIGLSAE